MSKRRYVSTHLWSDNYIIDLDPIEKLLFLYLLTNDNTNMLGIYELHVRKIAFDTGIDKDMVLKIFDRFNRDGKASYMNGYVALHNFSKNQSYNDNMKVSAINNFNELPLEVRKQQFCKPILKGMEPLPKGSKPIAEYEVECEEEEEREVGMEPQEEKEQEETGPVSLIKKAETKKDLLKVWEAYRKTKGKHMTLYERDVILNSTWLNKSIHEIKKTLLHTIDKGWLNLHKPDEEETTQKVMDGGTW